MLLVTARRLAALLVCAPLASLARAEDSSATLSAQPFPAIAALAEAQRIPLTGFDAARTGADLLPGDAVTVLFTLTEGDERQQWLADIRIVPLTPQERAAKPREESIHTGTGNEFRLASESAAFALRMFGPAREADAAAARLRERTARFLVPQDYLSFGWDRMGELALRLREIGQEIKLGFATGRFSDDQIAWGKRWAAETQFTSEDEMICVKQAFAQIAFLRLADRTPGFRDIAQASIDLPSVLTALWTRKFGVWFNYDWKKLERHLPSRFGLNGDAPVYTLPFGLTMFGKHVANGTWFATAARPPLLTSAGIIGLTIGPPANPAKRLELRVIAARLGPST